MRLKGLKHGQIEIAELELGSEPATCIIGRNASGKSTLGSLLAGEIAPAAGAIDEPPTKVALLSFESLQRDYETELAEEETDFQDAIDYGSTGRELLQASSRPTGEIEAAARRFELEGLLDRGYRQFSTGELRRLTLLREVLAQPQLLILDEPYEGLDTGSQQTIERFLHQLSQSGVQLLFLVNRLEDVPSWSQRLLILDRGKIVSDQPTSSALENETALQLFQLEAAPKQFPSCPQGAAAVSDPLVQLTNARVAYDGVNQFESFSWTLRPGEHTIVTGPNGSGKSTLLALLTGDHPQCYTNQIQIFGYRRGSGESIWDIKRHIGYVSPGLHRDYRVSCTLLTAVLSGFHDSIGLYEAATAEQTKVAGEWLDFFGLADFASQPFRSLSYGQQRLGLICRALVKQPALVILDEPTQGLDDLNRHLVLACLERLAGLQRSTLLFVSHRADERLPLFRHQLHFEPTRQTSPRYRILAKG